MTGRSAEVAESLQRRKVDIACIKETRWAGSKAQEIGCGYKFFYFGETSSKSGIGIAVNANLLDGILEIKPISDRLMWIKIVNRENKRTYAIVVAYAPQSSCPEAMNLEFRNSLEDCVNDLARDTIVIIGGDFNGHVGKNAQEDDSHGNNGYGMRNASGENIIQFANAMEMTIANTRFKKRSSQLITYESGQNKTQVDYILVAAKQAGNIIHCKVIPSEYAATQHKLVVMDLRMGIKEKSHPKVAIHKIKWWKLQETYIREQYHHLVNPELVYVRTWNELEEQIHKAGEKACGVTNKVLLEIKRLGGGMKKYGQR